MVWETGTTATLPGSSEAMHCSDRKGDIGASTDGGNSAEVEKGFERKGKSRGLKAQFFTGICLKHWLHWEEGKPDTQNTLKNFVVSTPRIPSEAMSRRRFASESRDIWRKNTQIGQNRLRDKRDISTRQTGHVNRTSTGRLQSKYGGEPPQFFMFVGFLLLFPKDSNPN